MKKRFLCLCMALLLALTLIPPCVDRAEAASRSIAYLSDSKPLTARVNDNGYIELTWGPIYFEDCPGEYVQPAEYYVRKCNTISSERLLMKLCRPESGKTAYTYVDKDVSAGYTYEYELAGYFGGIGYLYTDKIVSLTTPPRETHTHNYIYTNVVPATCHSMGYTEHICSCGKVGFTDQSTDMLPHTWDNGKITKTSVATIITYTCKICGATDREVIPVKTCASPTITTYSCNASSGKPTLKWNAVTGAAQYEIYRATSSSGTYTKMYTTTSTSYTNTSATPGYTYYYYVKAINDNGVPSNASFAQAITCDCAQPVVTISTNASSGKPTLKWKAVTGADKYEIYRATSSSGTYSKMYTTTSTSYTNTGAEVGKTYYYKVRALSNKSSYATSAYSAVKSITCDCAKPVLSITTSNGHPKLSWNTVTGATKYYIYRSTDGTNFSYYDSTTKTNYTNTSAKAGTTYYYKVKAISSKSSYADSAYSAVKSIKAK